MKYNSQIGYVNGVVCIHQYCHQMRSYLLPDRATVYVTWAVACLSVDPSVQINFYDLGKASRKKAAVFFVLITSPLQPISTTFTTFFERQKR